MKPKINKGVAKRQPKKKLPKTNRNTKDNSSLTPKQKAFCREYVIDWNGTRSYLKAYPNVKSENIAAASSSRLLRNVKIADYCAKIQENLDELCGISKAMILKEHKKLAFSSIAHLHKTWITRKEFEELTEDQKASIAEISTKMETMPGDKGEKSNQVEFVKIKLYDKQRSLDSIAKLRGYEAPNKTEVTGKDGKPLISAIKIEIIDSATQVVKDDSGS
jgi:phage terminase small subunit